MRTLPYRNRLFLWFLSVSLFVFSPIVSFPVTFSYVPFFPSAFPLVTSPPGVVCIDSTCHLTSWCRFLSTPLVTSAHLVVLFISTPLVTSPHLVVSFISTPLVTSPHGVVFYRLLMSPHLTSLCRLYRHLFSPHLLVSFVSPPLVTSPPGVVCIASSCHLTSWCRLYRLLLSPHRKCRLYRFLLSRHLLVSFVSTPLVTSPPGVVCIASSCHLTSWCRLYRFLLSRHLKCRLYRLLLSPHRKCRLYRLLFSPHLLVSFVSTPLVTSPQMSFVSSTPLVTSTPRVVCIESSCHLTSWCRLYRLLLSPHPLVSFVSTSLTPYFFLCPFVARPPPPFMFSSALS